MGRRVDKLRVLLLALAWGALAVPAGAALQVASVSPQGEVAQVRQVVVRFQGAATALGDARAPAPLSLSCSDPAASQGTGRWLNEREWVYDFARDLPPGVRCELRPNAAFQAPQGNTLDATARWRFATGGPFVRGTRPYQGAEVEEEQAFVLLLNGPATPQSVREQVWCAVDGLGERVPVRLIEGAEREALLKAAHVQRQAGQAGLGPLSVLTLACNRRLPPGGRVSVVFGAGVATPSGIPNRVEKRFTFDVREPFTASFSCERENAQAACLPIRPMTLQFSAPVPRALAEKARLKSPGGAVAPVIDDGVARDGLVDNVRFKPVGVEQAALSLEVPADLKDASGRPLANADQFPLAVRTGVLPPLAKFAASPFGVVERFAEPDGQALVPVTLRRVEGGARSQLRTLTLERDADIIAWQRKLERYDRFMVERQQATADGLGPLPRVLEPQDKAWVQPRMLSLLDGQAQARRLELPQAGPDDPRPFEVVGIPLPPGFHVMELSSVLLGQALLDERHGGQRTMHVRSSALVTNLGVHFKLGRENAVAWVTTLDKGQPVPGAAVRVSDCRGRELASATTDAKGLASFTGLSSNPPHCGEGAEGYFVSARAQVAGQNDMAFAWSGWTRGIESWRFNLPASSEPQPDQRAHTVFDRTLVRAGETVSMKHLLRTETGQGLELPARTPDTLVVTHAGSGQRYTQPLAWRRTATGGLSAESEFKPPAGARLGAYDVALSFGADGQQLPSGQFRVEAFRLPVLQGRIAPVDRQPAVQAETLPLDVSVTYVAGGGAARLPVRVSAMVQNRWLSFPGFDGFSFEPPRPAQDTPGSGDDEEEGSAASDSRVVADKLPLTLDAQGAGRLTIPGLPRADRPQDLQLEASYADPNGEIQTLRSTVPLWPAAVLAGIRTEGWVSVRGRMKLQALALDLAGKPRAGVPLEVRAVARTTTTSRKRLVGGFYAYDSQTQVKDLGAVCSGRSDSRGLLLCDVALDQAGEVELVASARDDAGRSSRAASTVWVTRQGELWFGGENHDRMDLLPEKRAYQPGETARLQVRMPFRRATALVAVEREGVVWTEVVQLNGQDPTVDLKIRPEWGPNVFVSVLALRGRLHEVPWYSFFTWGFKAPREWWNAYWHEGREYAAPTALVDLSKPAFRLGATELLVDTAGHKLAVEVKTDKADYPVRGKARVSLQVRLPDGKPAAQAEVALAAVDEALLELMPNTSWDVLTAMLQRRPWGVETATAQMEIVGRRHYGRKAVPAGGGGGRAPTRELLDTLLLWNPRITLDAQGRAEIELPLNDALTRFRVVAVADAGPSHFGNGHATLRTTQDLQLISGLPPLVRADDRYRAAFTLRNTTARAMSVEVTPRATLLEVKPLTLDIPAGEAREAAWEVVVPPALADTRSAAILWEVEARERGSGGARDALKASQRVLPAVPVTVQQATVVRLDGPYGVDVAAPAGALPERGGIRLNLSPRLAEGLPGVLAWFERYPYTCLEQRASRALGLRDAAAWRALAAQMPAYLDADGLAGYFPPREGDERHGSDTLSAYLLAVSHEAAQWHPELALPDDVKARLAQGLTAFVEGRTERRHWSPQRDLEPRKLAAIEALSRHGLATPRLLESLTVAPDQWPTHAVIDWWLVLRRLEGVPQREQRLAQATQVLRARLSYQGTRLLFSREREDHWWWLMQGGDVNAARLLAASLEDPAWKEEWARLANGLIGRQQGGAWSTTTANLWGSLALEGFSRRLESTPVAGNTRATLAGRGAAVDWRGQERSAELPWPPARERLEVSHAGSGAPWLTVQASAAVPLTAPVAAGYRVRRVVTPVEQAVPGQYSRGDVLRVSLEVEASADMTWVVLSDPVPGGATILGSGLGRDSQIAARGERRTGVGWLAFEERGFDAFRAYYAYLPQGLTKVEYTVRLNNVGRFGLPPTRVEAMYAPEMHGESPNEALLVGAGR